MLSPCEPFSWPTERRRLLLVDGDELQRALLRTTLAILDAEVDEARSLASAAVQIGLRYPDLVVLGWDLPTGDPLAFCRQLQANPHTASIPIVVIDAGVGPLRELALRDAGVARVLHWPAGPLELVETIEALIGERTELRVGSPADRPSHDQVVRYAQDLLRLLELERGQRVLLQRAYRQPVDVLADELASKDTGTRAHSHRVQRYARRLTAAIDRSLLCDPGLDYGFLLHDVGKIGIPDRILLKAGPLTPAEQRLMRTHTVLGEQMVAGISALGGAGLGVVRSHHERWDGRGYPDGLIGADTPVGARIFAVVDALDAMTTERPYRRATSWPDAVDEIRAQSARQFDPSVVEAFGDVERDLHGIYHELAAA